MFSWDARRVLSVTAAAALICCLVAPWQLGAASPNMGADVTYVASGTFAVTPVSGADTLKLAGQPFTISVVGNSSLKPVQHGQNFAIFKPLQMTGTVYSGLIPNQPIAVSSTTAAINQVVSPTEDIFESGFPVVVVGVSLNVRARLVLPGGTLTTPLLRPFASIALTPANATVTYSNSTASTVLAVQTGTLVATLPASAPVVTAAAAARSTFVWMPGAQAIKPRGLPAIWL